MRELIKRWSGRAGARAGNAEADRLIEAGNRAEDAGRLADACASYRAAVRAAPRYARAQLNLGIGLEAAGDADGAAAAYDAALALDPADVYVNYNFGKLLHTRGDGARAERLLRAALARKPDFPEALVALAAAHESAGRLADAAAGLEAAIALRPRYAGALANYAGLLERLGRRADAESAWRRALEADPESGAALVALGNLAAQDGRLDEAEALYRRALEVDPDSIDALTNLGNVLRERLRMDDAAACYRRALELDPQLGDVQWNLAQLLREQCRFEESLAAYRRAISIAPEHAPARWSLAIAQIPIVYEADADPAAAREAFAAELERLERWFDADHAALGEGAVGVLQPFYLAYQEENNAALLGRYGALCARLMADWYARQGYEPIARAGARAGEAAAGAPARGGPLRVGIVSYHFSQHSVWNAIVKGWLRHADRARIEFHGFHLGRARDAETGFAHAHCARFDQGLGGLSDWVRAIRERRLDALIYPEIGMDPMTVKLASLRLAPLQAASWGHPVSTGLPTIDAFLSAADMEPAGAEAHYTERLVPLPGLGCSVEPWSGAPAVPDLAALGLDASVPLLVCPGTPFKYAPQHDHVFPEIAARLGRCRFVFFVHEIRAMSEALRRRLETVFARARLDFEQHVSFVPWLSPPAFRGLLARADVFLDTIGFSGFNTAMQALECAVPPVTCEGRFLRGRLASAILRRIGLDELVVPDDAAYVELAVRLCRDAEYRAHVAQRIEAGRAALYDDPAPARALQDFLEEAALG